MEATPVVTIVLPSRELTLEWDEFLFLHLAAVTIYHKMVTMDFEDAGDDGDFLILAD